MATAAVVDPLHECRYRYIVPGGNLAQTIPELVLQGHARLVSIEYDRVLDDRRFHQYLPASDFRVAVSDRPLRETIVQTGNLTYWTTVQSIVPPKRG